MPDWSEWRAFPDPRNFGILVAPFGPGVYELRNEDVLVYCGSGGNVALRMSSLLPTPLGAGTRNNAPLRDYILRNLPRIEYRTLPCSTRTEATTREYELKQASTYLFHT
ncbi:hypothetical protein R70006_03785 [Paraburkholderia domus]|uniref:hypothetical protein n=1 Tax=Paraburkholderia domus TaxID=2793075 RepID=UPI001913B982|nr:hypothetical protein [Paraburkholderia domus]MBK5047252.1 hypothetical protein [Burkholderia sp. R-70006]CAE6767441.1 hypothetical protein R70006_03785 [Paraburkholderia domus]